MAPNSSPRTDLWRRLARATACRRRVLEAVYTATLQDALVHPLVAGAPAASLITSSAPPSSANDRPHATTTSGDGRERRGVDRLSYTVDGRTSNLVSISARDPPNALPAGTWSRPMRPDDQSPEFPASSNVSTPIIPAPLSHRNTLYEGDCLVSVWGRRSAWMREGRIVSAFG